jgi:hypothetical protein
MPRRKYASKDAPRCVAVAPQAPAALRAGNQHHVKGGSTTEAHARNIKKVEAHLLKQRIEKRPLPATAQYPNEVSLILYAKEADISEKAAFGKTIRAMVRATAQKVGVAVRVRQPCPSRPRLQDTLDFAIVERKRDNVRSSIASDTGVDDLRNLIVKKAAGNSHRNMKLDAEAALKALRKRVDNGAVRLSNREKSALSRVEKCLRKQLQSGGMPDDFPGRFTICVKLAGLTFAALARLVGVDPGLLDTWGRGRSAPDKWNEPIVSRCAEHLGLAPEFLLDSIDRGRVGVAKLPICLFPKHIRGSEHIELRRAMAGDFPGNILYLDKDEQHRLVWEAMSRCRREMAPRSNHANACRDRYGYRDWNPLANAQFKRLFEYMRLPVSRNAPVRETTWCEDTACIRHNQLCFALGYAVSESAGKRRFKPNEVSLTILADPNFVRDSLTFRLERKKKHGGEQNIVELDAEFFGCCGGMFRKRGWIRNDAGMRKALGFGRKSDAAWNTYCDGIAEKYAEEAWLLRRQAKRTRPQFEAVRPALDMPEPVAVIKFLADALNLEYRNCINADAHSAAGILQDEVYNLMQEQAPFRPGTTVRVEYYSDNSGHLRRDADGWYLVIPRKLFKNGKYMKADFRRRLKDRWGLYGKLEKFVEWGRLDLLGEIRSPYLFVYGLKNLPAFIAKPCHKTMKPIKAALVSRVCKFTKRHLVWNQKTGKGIEGFKKGFSPSAYRHIGVTSIIRKSKNWQQAADLIADSVEVTKEFYGEFLMSDRDDDRDATKEDIAVAAEAGARELQAKGRDAVKSSRTSKAPARSSRDPITARRRRRAGQHAKRLPPVRRPTQRAESRR